MHAGKLEDSPEGWLQRQPMAGYAIMTSMTKPLRFCISLPFRSLMTHLNTAKEGEHDN